MYHGRLFVNGPNSMGAHRRIHSCRSRPAWRLPFLVMSGLLVLALAAGRIGAQAATQRATADEVSTSSSDSLALRLDAMRRELLAQHPTIRARRMRLERARALAEAAGRPAALVASTGLSEAPASAIDQGNLRFEVGREVGARSRLRAERAVAEIEVEVAASELDAAMREVGTELLRLLVSSAGVRNIDERLSATEALLIETEEGLRTRFAVGEARFVDVIRLRTERLRVQSERAELVATQATSRAALHAMLATADSGGAARLASADSMIARVPLAGWRRQLPSDDGMLERLPTSLDVRLADAAVVRAARGVTLGTASRRSRMDAFVGVQRIGQANNGPTFGPSAGFSWTLPRTAAGANQRAALAEDLELRASTEARRATAAEVRARSAGAYAHYRAALRRIDAFDAALLAGAREEREGALAAYRAQQLSLLELLDFERALARAEIDAIGAVIDAAEAYAALLRVGVASPDVLPSEASVPSSRPER